MFGEKKSCPEKVLLKRGEQTTKYVCRIPSLESWVSVGLVWSLWQSQVSVSQVLRLQVYNTTSVKNIALDKIKVIDGHSCWGESCAERNECKYVMNFLPLNIDTYQNCR